MLCTPYMYYIYIYVLAITEVATSLLLLVLLLVLLLLVLLLLLLLLLLLATGYWLLATCYLLLATGYRCVKIIKINLTNVFFNNFHYNARVMKKRDAFRINVVETKPYNATFDGNEMNIDMTKKLSTETELRHLAVISNRIVSPDSTSPIIGIYQDSMLKCFRRHRVAVKHL